MNIQFIQQVSKAYLPLICYLKTIFATISLDPISFRMQKGNQQIHLYVAENIHFDSSLYCIDIVEHTASRN